MNKEDVLKLAREAHGAMLESGRGMYLWHGDAYAGDVQDFCERFAALVAQRERDELVVMFLEAHEGAKTAHNYWAVAANKIKERNT